MEENEVSGEEVAAEVAETEEPTTSTTEEVETPPADDTDAEAPKSKGVQKRIDELVKQREEERRRAERLESILEQTIKRQQEVPKPEEPKAPVFQPTRPEPTLAGCDYDTERYVRESREWDREQYEVRQRQQMEQLRTQEHQQNSARAFEEKRVATLNEGKAKYPDFDEVINVLPATVMHKGLAAAVLDTESPADIAYYLGKNPEEATRISKLNPKDMLVAVIRLEGKAKAVVPPKETTKAPPPVSTVGKVAGSNAEPDPAKDPEGWLKWERARVAAKGRRY